MKQSENSELWLSDSIFHQAEMANRLAEKLLILRDRGQGLLLRIYNMKRGFHASAINTPEESLLMSKLRDFKSLSSFVKTVLAAKKFSNLANSTTWGSKVIEDIMILKQVTISIQIPRAGISNSYWFGTAWGLNKGLMGRNVKVKKNNVTKRVKQKTWLAIVNKYTK